MFNSNKVFLYIFNNLPKLYSYLVVILIFNNITLLVLIREQDSYLYNNTNSVYKHLSISLSGGVLEYGLYY